MMEKHVPTFKLYGEQEHWPMPDMLHCETISVRSKLHDWHIKAHRHNGLFQILFLSRGSALVQLDGQSHRLAVGQILVVPQMCIHGFEFSSNAEGHVLTLAYPLLDRLMQQMQNKSSGFHTAGIHTLRADEDSRYTRAAFGALEREYRNSAPCRNQMIEALLTTILIWVARQPHHFSAEQPQELARGSRHFAKFCSLMEEGYIRHYSLAHYAGEIGISAAHLNVLCRQMADKSALALIHERLMLEARRNLVYTSMTISQVSYAIGFSDPAYFTRFFKREVGLSPKDFRREVLQFESDRAQQG